MFVFYKKNDSFYISKYKFHPPRFPRCFVTALDISIFRYVQRAHIFIIHNIVKSVHIYMHFTFRIITVRSFFIIPQFLRINFYFDENFIEPLFFFLFSFQAMEACESFEYLYRTRDMHIYLHVRQMRSVTGKSFIGRHKHVPRTSCIFTYLYLVSIMLKSARAFPFAQPAFAKR